MNTSLSKIIELLNSDNFYEAEQEIRKIYNKNPNSFDLNKILGAAMLAQRKYNVALKCYEKCFSIKKDDYDVLVNLGFILLKTQFYDQSIDFCNKALSIHQWPHAYQNLASCYFHLRDYTRAEENAKNAIELRGGFDANAFLNTEDLVSLYGNILLAQKKNEEFTQYALKTLEKKYVQRLLIMLSRENKGLILDSHISMAKTAIENAVNLNKKIERNTQISDACFFLAEYYSDQDQQLSESYYTRGNLTIAEMQRESIYQRQKYALGIYDFFKRFDDSQIKKEIDPKKGEGLVFVLGMPRSGTTLLESILYTSQDLVPGGEKSFFTLQLFEFITSLAKQENINFDLDFARDLGDRYLENIKAQKGDAKFFVDKLPENYLYLRFIKLCLPGAKFIHCQRDPWDNAISLYKQNYSVNIFYASSFFGIAAEYANHEFIMQTWKNSELGDCILDQKYEDLVQNIDESAKKIWSFLGLPGAFDLEKRKGYVGYTASMQQVTKDIYSTSVQKNDFIDQKATFFKDLENQRQYWRGKLQ